MLNNIERHSIIVHHKFCKLLWYDISNGLEAWTSFLSFERKRIRSRLSEQTYHFDAIFTMRWSPNVPATPCVNLQLSRSCDLPRDGRLTGFMVEVLDSHSVVLAYFRCRCRCARCGLGPVDYGYAGRRGSCEEDRWKMGWGKMGREMEAALGRTFQVGWLD
jgi:hypothetical protein